MPASKWAEKDLEEMKRLGLFEGDQNGNLQPRKFVERQELAAVIHRMTHA